MRSLRWRKPRFQYQVKAVSYSLDMTDADTGNPDHGWASDKFLAVDRVIKSD